MKAAELPEESSPPNVRPAETRRLLGALDALRDGRSRAVELVGEPGAGKTRLLRELAAEAGRRGVRVLSGRCTEAEGAVALYPFAQVLAEGAPEPAVSAGTAPNPDIRTALWQAAGHGMVLLLDDFHAADPESLAAMDTVVRWPIPAPLLIVVAQRERQSSPRLRASFAHGVELGTVASIRLEPLTMAQCARLLGLPADDPALPVLCVRSQGNPLYLLAMGRTRPAAESAAADPLTWEVTGQAATLLMGELASLSAEESRVLTAAAVLGDVVDQHDLGVLTELPADTTAAAVAALVRRDLLRPADQPGSYTHRHPMLRRQVYWTADAAGRQLAHRRAVSVLTRRLASARCRAEHIARSLPHSGPADAWVLRAAAADALATDPDEAVRWLCLALRVMADHRAGAESALVAAERQQLSLLLAQALGAAGRMQESRDRLHALINELTHAPSAVRMPAVTSCAMVECWLGNYNEADRLLAAELAEPDPDGPIEVATALIHRAWVAVLSGRLPPDTDLALAVAVARRHRDPVAEAGALAVAGLRQALSRDISRSERTLDACAEVVDGLFDGGLGQHVRYVAILAWAEAFVGRFVAAQRHFERAIALARKTGQRPLLPSMLAGLSNALLVVGSAGDARRAVERADEIATSLGANPVHRLVRALAALNTVGHSRQSNDRAIALAEEAVGLLPPGCLWDTVARLALARTAMIANNPRLGVMVLLDVGGGRDLHRLAPLFRPACFEMLTDAALQIDDVASATEWSDKAWSAAEDLGQPVQRAHALAARAHILCRQGNPGEAIALYQQAAQMFSDSSLVGGQTRMLILAAGTSAAAGGVETGLGLLALAKQLARQTGKDWLVRSIGEQETKLQAKSADAAQPDVAQATDAGCEQRLSALTVREQEIADIAGQGVKTREIAQQLSLSPRTVEVHLTRIYRKLNVSSRAELARLMACRA